MNFVRLVDVLMHSMHTKNEKQQKVNMFFLKQTLFSTICHTKCKYKSSINVSVAGNKGGGAS